MINNCVDSSTYPSMFCDYLSFVLQHFFGHAPMSWEARWGTSAALTCLVCALNLRGISLAARASACLAFFSLLPFALMALLTAAAPHEAGAAALLNPAPLASARPDT